MSEKAVMPCDGLYLRKSAVCEGKFMNQFTWKNIELRKTWNMPLHQHLGVYSSFTLFPILYQTLMAQRGATRLFYFYHISHLMSLSWNEHWDTYRILLCKSFEFLDFDDLPLSVEIYLNTEEHGSGLKQIHPDFLNNQTTNEKNLINNLINYSIIKNYHHVRLKYITLASPCFPGYPKNVW